MYLPQASDNRSGKEMNDFQSLLHQGQVLINSSPVISGGITLTVMGVGIAFLRNLPGKIVTSIYNQLVSTAVVEGRDATLFDWVEVFLTSKTSKKRHSLAFTRNADSNRLTYSTSGNTPVAYAESPSVAVADNRPKILLAPAKGSSHFIVHKGTLISFTRQSDKESKEGAMANLATLNQKFDSYHLKFFTRDQEKVAQFFRDCRDFTQPLDERITISTSNYDYWLASDHTHLRPLESVVFPDGVVDKLLDDITTFQQEKSWYQGLGIPHRRGYLLHGPPGNGKSSLIAGIASHLGMNVNILRLADKSMSDSNLVRLMNQSPSSAILVIEDVDCITSKRDIEADSTLSFSGVLNALDGLQSKDGRIIFMTTNHIENLDPALIRCGRIDVQIEVGNADSDRGRKMFTRFFPTVEVDAEMFEPLDKGHKSMADLQELFLLHRKKPESITKESFQ